MNTIYTTMSVILQIQERSVFLVQTISLQDSAGQQQLVVNTRELNEAGRPPRGWVQRNVRRNSEHHLGPQVSVDDMEADDCSSQCKVWISSFIVPSEGALLCVFVLQRSIALN